MEYKQSKQNKLMSEIGYHLGYLQQILLELESQLKKDY